MLLAFELPPEVDESLDPLKELSMLEEVNDVEDISGALKDELRLESPERDPFVEVRERLPLLHPLRLAIAMPRTFSHQ